jgi:TRAP-type C4-dicarboxylate transport system substrate-binding protein
MISRRRFLTCAAVLVGPPAIMRHAQAQAPEVSLRLHHFLPSSTTGQVRFLAPWAQKVAHESNGRIKIDIYPAMTLGGTAPQLFDQARDGIVDLVWTLPGYTPGRFPISETFELPFVASRKALTNSRALSEFAEAHMADEFREVHPICFWTHDHGLIHANRPVRTVQDLEGLKLRFPTRLAGEALRALGASPIGMPVPQVPESLSQRVIDGAVLPWEVVPSIRVHELVRNHTDIPGSPTLYTATFVLAMNKARYNSLPADLKQVIDANSGEAASSLAGKVWDEQGVTVAEQVRSRGNTLITLTEEEAANWRKLTEPVIARWLKSAAERGLNGTKLLESARAAIAKYES